MSTRKLSSWRRKQVKTARARAKGNSRRFRMLRGNNYGQILLRMYKGNRAAARSRMRLSRKKRHTRQLSPVV